MSVSEAQVPRQTTQEAGDAGDTRALILRTAEALFMEHGYAAVSMSQIVEEICKTRKLSKPAIYYHFADKEALFIAVLDHVIERRGKAITVAGMTDGDLTARVTALAAALATGRDYFMVVRSAIGELGPAFRERFGHAMRAELDDPVVRAFERAAERGELRPGITPTIAAATLIGIVVHLSFRESLEKSGRDIPALAAGILLHGIGAREER
ncbi:MAG: TetR/AcrR family transcriptional regulator [Chloroflexota bacterium]|nr:TetR/AcrR family transcriptional regulator [Chloroflexota bacterium]